MNLIGLIFALLVFCAIIWAARTLMAAFGIGDPIASVVYVFLVLIVLLWLFSQFGGASFGSLGRIH